MRNSLTASALALSLLSLLLLGGWIAPTFSDLRNRAATLEGQVSSFSDRIESSRDTLSKIESSNNRLRASIDSLTGRLISSTEGLEGKITQSTSKLDAFSRSTESLKAELSAEVKNLSAKLASAEAELKAAREENARLKSELSRLIRNFDGLKTQVGSAAATVYDIAKPGVVSITVYDQSNSKAGVGSGFVYSKDGHIVTNNHVAAAGVSYLLTFLDGSQVSASMVGKDPQGDIAVLLAKLPPFAKPLEIADSNKLRIGEPAFAIGSPVGLVGSITGGIVSQLNRTVADFSFLFYVQTDTPINPGNSGGPLLNSEGKVIGINTFGTSKSFTEGLGFAIPSNILKRVVPRLIEVGAYQYPLLGIRGRFLDPIQARALNLSPSVTSGWLVDEIISGTGASRSNLRVGDIILSINDSIVRYEHDISYILNQLFSPGDRVTLKVLRVDRMIDIELTLTSR